MIEREKQLMTVSEIAEYLQIKVSTIYGWTHIGYIPHIKIGRAVRFRSDDIDRWLSAKTKKGRKTHVPNVQLD